MSKLALGATRQKIYQWFVAQICVVALVSLISFFLKGVDSVLATFLGGLICIGPQAILARWVFAYYRAKAGRHIVQKFYLSELLKLLITGLLFVLALIKLPLYAPELLLGFISAQFSSWFAPYIVKFKVGKK